MSAMLQISNVSFCYEHRQVFERINLTLNAGSSTALIGANGSGKTTLLRLASGTLKPRSGSVLLKGSAIAGMSHQERSRVVALVPQQLEMPFDFTVQQIVEQGRTPYLGLLRRPAIEDRDAVDRAMQLTDTIQFRHRIFNQLSGGERQRVKIALGLAQRAELLLLDEPTQNLDIGRQAELMDLLHRLQGEGITILASIHDLHLVHGNFDDVHLLGPDRSLVSGTAHEVLTPDNLAKAFHYASGRSLSATRQICGHGNV